MVWACGGVKPFGRLSLTRGTARIRLTNRVSLSPGFFRVSCRVLHRETTVATHTQALHSIAAAPLDAREEYVAFGNMESRNGLQARVEIPMMLRTLRLPLGCRILEVGCGRGVALPVLHERLAPRQLTGVDIDRELVNVAKSRVAAAGLDVTVVEGDVRALPFPSNRFDIVIDFGTCYHV